MFKNFFFILTTISLFSSNAKVGLKFSTSIAGGFSSVNLKNKVNGTVEKFDINKNDPAILFTLNAMIIKNKKSFGLFAGYLGSSVKPKNLKGDSVNNAGSFAVLGPEFGLQYKKIGLNAGIGLTFRLPLLKKQVGTVNFQSKKKLALGAFPFLKASFNLSKGSVFVLAGYNFRPQITFNKEDFPVNHRALVQTEKEKSGSLFLGAGISFKFN